MDPMDTFYQHLDSEQLLKRHGPELVADAREALANDADSRFAGFITTPDSQDAEAVRQMLMTLSGREVPAGMLMVGLAPRASVEALLTARSGVEHWKEEPWQPQLVLPVVVSTRDGFRFGFFGLGDGEAGADGFG